MCACSVVTEGDSEQQGSVLAVEDASDDSSHRSWVRVKWDAGGVHEYRRGHEGSVDIRCATAADGEMYYVTHLPTLGNRRRDTL